MYVYLGDFRVSRGPPTVPLTRILRNAIFFKSQNLRKAGTLCSWMPSWATGADWPPTTDYLLIYSVYCGIWEESMMSNDTQCITVFLKRLIYIYSVLCTCWFKKINLQFVYSHYIFRFSKKLHDLERTCMSEPCIFICAY